jgi:hypothetical protein
MTSRGPDEADGGEGGCAGDRGDHDKGHVDPVTARDRAEYGGGERPADVQAGLLDAGSDSGAGGRG